MPRRSNAQVRKSSEADMSPSQTQTQSQSQSQDQSQSQTVRRSGRAVKKPSQFSSQTMESSRTTTEGGESGARARSKRKRQTPAGDGDANEDNVDDDENQAGSQDESDSDESMPEGDQEDEEEAKARQRQLRTRKNKANGPKPSKASQPRRSSKKQKTDDNGTTLTTALAELAITPAVSKATKRVNPPKQRKRRVSPSGFANEEGLYAEVFGRGHTADAVAAEWLTRYEQHNINALMEFINFILKCSGMGLTVTSHDIEDVDNAANRLNDLQEEYQTHNITDYPLISREKMYRGFQDALVDFIESIMKTLHSSATLYSDTVLIENLQVWITAMSSASIRPFRHTATVVSLSMVTALCEIAKEIISTTANTRKQLEAEEKKKSVNKGRVHSMKAKIEECTDRLKLVESNISDCIDTVFVHRYRDVDPKIRTECMNALGNWIALHRDMFFDSNYLRYMGWVLSDTNGHARSVVLAQLRRLFANKDNLPGLRAFTEKFRPRILEMALRDAEWDVRTSAVELLELVRQAGYLESEDIEQVSRLIFATDSHVRQAAGRFFVANIEDVVASVKEPLEEDIDEVLDVENDLDNEDFLAPNQLWIKYKCLADILGSYDTNAEDLPEIASATNVAKNPRLDSRFAMATEAIYPHFLGLHNWESLAGYLLYDHSQIARNASQDEDADAATVVRNLYRLSEGQENILLEVLGCSVKLHLLEITNNGPDQRGAHAGAAKKSKVSAAVAEKIEECHGSIAHRLALVIPQLLNKFGSVPESASAILRLEHLLNLDYINDLQKGASAYTDLVAHINKQFLTHSDQSVLAEATAAFLHARTSNEMKDAMENQVQELWDDTLTALSTLLNGESGEEQTFSAEVLTALCSTIMRIANLVSVADCTELLERAASTGGAESSSTAARGGNARRKSAGVETNNGERFIDLILSLTKRALFDEDSGSEVTGMERELILNSLQISLVYFMWKVQGLSNTTKSYPITTAYFDPANLEQLAARRDTFSSNLISIIQQRKGTDIIRLSATTTLLDLTTVFGTLRQDIPAPDHINADGEPDDDEETIAALSVLIQELPPRTTSLIFSVHHAHEKAYARLHARKLETSLDEEVDDTAAVGFGSSDDEDEGPARSNAHLEDEDDNENDDDDDDDDDMDGHGSTAKSISRTRDKLLAEQRLCELTGKIVLAIIGKVIPDDAGAGKRKLLLNKSHLGPNYKEVVAYLEEKNTTGKGKGRKASAKGKKDQEKVDEGTGQPNGGPGDDERQIGIEVDDEPHEEIEDDEGGSVVVGQTEEDAIEDEELGD